jgi:beta-glucanase (GH16 family)
MARHWRLLACALTACALLIAPLTGARADSHQRKSTHQRKQTKHHRKHAKHHRRHRGHQRTVKNRSRIAPNTRKKTGTPAPTPAPPSSANPSGQAMPVGDIPGWHQVFTDNFGTNVPLGSFPSAVSSRWGAYSDGWADTSHNGRYYCSKVCSVQGGLLNLHLHTENGVHMVAAPYPKIPGATSHNGQLYGRYAIRFRADPLPGYKTAWLLWPDSGTWPRDGEIDFPEGGLNSTICAFMHRQGGTSGSDQDRFCTSSGYNAWHTAVVEWTPSSVKFTLDGSVIGTSTSRIPNTPMHWVIQTETATSGGAPATSTAGNVQIDWVAVYRRA